MVEMNALLKATSIAKTELETFLADAAWCYPKASATKSRQLHRIFNARRSVEKKPYDLRGTCSEFLGLYGMMRFFVALRLMRHSSCRSTRLAKLWMQCWH